ncbi:MAG: Cys-tRNA(Pro) deacylase [Acidimicrobiales bacterium]
MTPAVELLRSLGIDHRIVEYEHDPSHRSFGEEAVEALGVDPDHVFKTLMVTLDDGTHAIGVIPVTTRLDLKAIAAAAGSKRATMTDPTQAERRSGYVVGGISPFGQRQMSATFVDESARGHDEIYCSAGRRGVEIVVAPEAFEHALDATFAPISTSGLARVAP